MSSRALEARTTSKAARQIRLPFFYGWLLVGVSFVTMAIGVNARTAFSLLFPQILDEFGWDRGVTAGAFSFGFLIQPPSGSPSRSPKHSHGMRHRATSSVTATPRMAPRSPGGCKPWAFATGRSRHTHRAKRACRTADRLDPTRVSRPCRGVGGTAPPSSLGELRDLLQPGAHAPCARQGYSAPSTGADSRAYCISHLARRSTSALRCVRTKPDASSG